MLPPAKAPCGSCPYRRDAPSGVWSVFEYDRLRDFDREMALQPLALFGCHQHDRASDQARMCAGWVGCHGADNLLGVRVGLVSGEITPDTYWQAAAYVSPVPLFASGGEAADHGLADIESPGRAARRAMAKIMVRRGDLRDED